jgi:ATP-binding cassette subfamily B protein
MPPKTSNKYVLLGYYIKQHWLSYSFGIVAILATNWIAVSIPDYVRLSIDLLNNDLEARQDLLWEYMLIMLGLAVVMIFVRTLSRILFFNPGRAIECQIKNDMFHKLMALQKDYYEANPSGNIISRINNDITGVRMICGFGMMQYSVRLGESCHILNGVIESAEVILKDCINPKPQIILTPVMSLLILEMMFPEGFVS